MRDGVVLRADVYRPRGEGPFPVLLMRLPYGKTSAESTTYAHPSWYARQGFIVVIQDCRGRWNSEGAFNPFFNEGPDGYDSVRWAARLPGSSGKVGTYGDSYPGATQLFSAVEGAPELACICPAVAPTDFFKSCFYEHGALQLALAMNWSLFVATDTARRAGAREWERRLDEAWRDVTKWYWYLPLRDF